MERTINIYCDESRHLPHDNEPCMVLGALWCISSKVHEYHAAIADLKQKHNLSKYFEVKWTKISNSKLSFYQDLIEMFFAANPMGFRAWIIPNKSVLRHDQFRQTHDDWYYKMYFYLLRNLIWQNWKYNVYIDIKDSRSREKLDKLREVLQNAHYDFSREVIQRVQHVRSHDIGLMQLADLLIGAISYNAAGLSTSPAKSKMVECIKNRSGFSLIHSTLPSFKKFNLCYWRPDNGGAGDA